GHRARHGAPGARGPDRGARRPAEGMEPAGEGYAAQGGDPVRVMIAEDSVLLREGLERLLTEAGVEVTGTAGNAEKLCTLVAHDPPDLVIVDIRLPPTHTDEGMRAAMAIRAD